MPICQTFTRAVAQRGDHRRDGTTHLAIWPITCSATSLGVVTSADLNSIA